MDPEWIWNGSDGIGRQPTGDEVSRAITKTIRIAVYTPIAIFCTVKVLCVGSHEYMSVVQCHLGRCEFVFVVRCFVAQP